MKRWQAVLFNGLAFVLALIVLANFSVARRNQRMAGELERKQQIINQARQAEPILDQIAKRTAHGSEKDPQLKSLLEKHKINVTLEVDGKKWNYP
jgi:hypothetical protein